MQSKTLIPLNPLVSHGHAFCFIWYQILIYIVRTTCSESNDTSTWGSCKQACLKFILTESQRYVGADILDFKLLRGKGGRGDLRLQRMCAIAVRKPKITFKCYFKTLVFRIDSWAIRSVFKYRTRPPVTSKEPLKSITDTLPAQDPMQECCSINLTI